MDILSRVKVTVDGQKYSTEERSTTVDLGGETNEAVVDADGNTHTTSTMKPGMIKTVFLAIAGFKLRPLQALKNGTIVLEGNNGQDFIMRNAKCGTASVIAGGKVEATFFGDVEEV